MNLTTQEIELDEDRILADSESFNMDDYYCCPSDVKIIEPITEALSDFLQDKDKNSHLINVKDKDVSACLKSLYFMCRFRLPSIYVSTLEELHESFVKGTRTPDSEADLYIINLDELKVPSDYLKIGELLSSEFNTNKSTYKLILIKSENIIYNAVQVDSQSFY